MIIYLLSSLIHFGDFQKKDYKMITILGGAKTGYNLYLLLKKNNIPSTFYYFKNEYGANKNGGKPVEKFKEQQAVDEVIVSSERAFVHFKKELEPRLTQHYYLRDKANIPAIAEALNVNTIGELSLDNIIYPAFVKPKQSGEGKVPFKTRLIENRNDLNGISSYINDCSIQRFLDSKDYKQISIAGYFTDTSDSLISVKQLNQYPLGVSSYVKFYIDTHIEDLKRDITNYLNSLNFRGFVELEFKIHKFDKVVYLMDINPRPWGWFYYYTSSVKNLRDVLFNNENPVINLKKSWVNLPRLILSNLKGNLNNPPVSEIVSNKICYEPYF